MPAGTARPPGPSPHPAPVRLGPARWAALLAVPVAVAALGHVAEHAPRHAGLSRAVQAREVPARALGSGDKAAILEGLGLVGAVPRNLRPPDAAPGGEAHRLPAAYSLDLARPEQLPSSTALPPGALEGGVPVLSVVLPAEELHDPRTGILADGNLERRGKAWERAAFVSYFEHGELRFGTAAGLRVHGGKSRLHSPHKSLRLYFRDAYGIDRVPTGVLFDGAGDPLRRLVIHNDSRSDRHGRRWHFVSPIAYEIVRRMGGIAPRTRPVRFYLNGERYGDPVLTERLDRHWLVAHRGHDEFNPGGGRLDESATDLDHELHREWRRFRAWATDERRPLTLAEARERVDVDNLTRWLLAVAFCGTTDADQGPDLLDLRDPAGRWFRVSWDMDHSFKDHYDLADEPWNLDVLRIELRRRSARSALLRRLIRDDPAYRELLADVAAEVLNHRIRQRELVAIVDAHRAQAARLGIEQDDVFDEIEAFLRRRPAVLREQLGRAAGLPDAHRVEVRGDDGLHLVVDGFREGPAYAGHYFEGSSIRIEARVRKGGHLAHWLVDGRRVDAAGTELVLPVPGPLSIRAVLSPDTGAIL